MADERESERAPVTPPAADAGTRKNLLDWTEDFTHENGCYENRCISCGNRFTGHKRRVTCKLCAPGEANEEIGGR